MQLVHIRDEIDKDLYLEKFCECCEGRLSTYLYIIKSIMFGIFHICDECKNDLECENASGMKCAFLQKNRKVVWDTEYQENPIR